MCLMEYIEFLRTYELMKKKMINLEVTRVFNSIGSNITLQLGDDIVIFTNGKERNRKEWSLRIGNAAWRLSKDGNYVVGSEDDRELIQSSIEKLVGKSIRSFQFISHFMDLEISFEDNYQLTTFFNVFADDQWALLSPDNNSIGIDCSNYNKIRTIVNIAKQFPIFENYQNLQFPIDEMELTKIIYNQNEHPILKFGNKYLIDLRFCTWRLQRDDIYLLGYVDLILSNLNFNRYIGKKRKFYYLINELIGKSLKKIEVNSFMDGSFYIEDQFILKTFSRLRSIHQWRIYNEENQFYAKIPILKSI